ncbi:elongation factor P [Halobacteriovorax sp. JY17]|uniref:elongation factor P n=1 Tax=Halobacteriovorax sp. JY17 TaxID=2014617 RepID=UPI000C40E515|nr:elongation factor P [Halobacteriovorax sp. JY17]PIK14484.1 MAG: elongation factor P [Halobacteriovorax sp. JY17]
MARELQTTELKKGVRLELDDKPYQIMKADFTNPGKGSAFTICKLKNLETGAVFDRTFKSGVGTGVYEPDLALLIVEYMYSDPDGFNFMDQSTFESIHVTTDQVGEAAGYLQEGIKLDLLFYKGNPIAIDLPNFVVLKIAETDPGLKGDTAQGGTKVAIMETGLQVKVPLFIKEGEIIKIDTRTGDYIERAKE